METNDFIMPPLIGGYAEMLALDPTIRVKFGECRVLGRDYIAIGKDGYTHFDAREDTLLLDKALVHVFRRDGYESFMEWLAKLCGYYKAIGADDVRGRIVKRMRGRRIKTVADSDWLQRDPGLRH